MYIDEQECTGCGVCIPFCPVGAIRDQGGAASIDFDECVECTVCRLYSGCPAEAIHESPETARWPRIVRRQFSDPLTPHSSTGNRGRGTEEMKTNDVTGRVKRGEVGIGMEFGRPGVGTRLSELEKMTITMAKLGAHFEPGNPVTHLLADPTTGKMKPELRDQRVLSAILEIQTMAGRLPEILPILQEVADQLDTVISWEIITRLDDEGNIPILQDLRNLGLEPRPNAKINLGMGRPLSQT